MKDHPNIVHLLGACECDMITEYFPVFLDEMLLEHKSGTPDDYPDSQVIGMALDAARGLQAIHEIPGGPVVHADLQPRQLLLNKEGVLKLNDLNRCRFMGRDEDGLPCPFKITKANGVWRSPEEFAGEVRNEIWRGMWSAYPFLYCKKHAHYLQVLFYELLGAVPKGLILPLLQKASYIDSNYQYIDSKWFVPNNMDEFLKKLG